MVNCMALINKRKEIHGINNNFLSSHKDIISLLGCHQVVAFEAAACTYCQTRSLLLNLGTACKNNLVS